MDFMAATGVEDNKKSQQDKNVVPKSKASFDVNAAKKRFGDHKTNINSMVEKTKALIVEDDESNTKAIEMMGQARKLSKTIDALAKEILKPHNDFRKDVNAFKKYFTDSLDSIVSSLRRKAEDYSAKLLLEKQKKEKEDREAREKLQESLDKEAKEAGVEKVNLPDVPAKGDSETGKTRTESGTSFSVNMVWSGKVQDVNKVPRDFCSPDQKKIDEAVEAGVRDIEGVEIKQVPKSYLRT